MNIRTFSYRFAQEIMQHPKYLPIYNEIIRVCSECPLPVFHGKSVNQRNKDVIQQIMNTFFRLRFEYLGWEIEPLATPDCYEDALRSDFRKTFYDAYTGEFFTVQIEVEFGNVASSYRNYFKFQLSFSHGLTSLCVLIVPSYKLANRIDTGVSNYEKVVREIPSAKLSITVPILVIGLFDEDDCGNPVQEWDVKAITEDQSILKGSRNDIYQEHRDIVQSYINILGQ